MAKSKSTAMNLSSHVSANHPIASKSPGILIASGKPESRMRRNSKSDATSSSQERLKDAYLGGLMDRVAGKPAATEKSQGSCNFPESESWKDNEHRVTGKPVQPEIQEIREILKPRVTFKRFIRL